MIESGYAWDGEPDVSDVTCNNNVGKDRQFTEDAPRPSAASAVVNCDKNSFLMKCMTAIIIL